MSTMLSPSSGSLTARSALRTASGAIIVGNLVRRRGPVKQRSTRGRGAPALGRNQLSYRVRQGRSDFPHGPKRSIGGRVETAIRQQDEEQITGRIEPKKGAGPAGMAVGRRRGQPSER